MGRQYLIGVDDLIETRTPENILLEAERAAILWDAILQLPHRLADVVQLRMRRWTYKQIGAELGLTGEAVRQREKRAFRELKRLIGERP